MKNMSKNCAAVLRKGISLLLVVMLYISMFPAISPIARAETSDWSSVAVAPVAGSGTEADPYQITSGAELAYTIKSNKYAILMNDIDLSEHEWIGNSNYTVVLDGNGKMISGLHLGTKSSPYKPTASVNGGLVKQLSGTIKNLALEVSIYIQGTSCSLGGIAGKNLGTIDGCSVIGTINFTTQKGHVLIGGIAGEMGTGRVLNCVNRASVTGEHAVDTITANMRVGGIVGYQSADGGIISNCVNLGSIYAKSPRAAASENNAATGICVARFAATISNCYNAGVISAHGTSSKGDISVGTFTQEDCYYLDAENEKYVKVDDDTVTYTTETALLEALNENAATAGADAGWMEWEMGNDGYPLPGKDLVPLRLAGSLVIDGDARYGQTLTAVLTKCNETNVTYQWRRSTETGYENIPGSTGIAYAITAEDIGHTLQVVVSAAAYENVLIANTGIVCKQAGPAAPEVTGVDTTTAAAKDGKLVGTTKAMEYSKFADFSTAYDCANGATTGLAVGVYYVRYKEQALVEASAYTQVVIWDASAPDLGYWTDAGNYTSGALSGSGTESDPYQITSAADLAKLAKEFNTAEATAGKYFKITAAEIDLSGHEWVPMTAFAGVLDGGNANIRGLYIGTEFFPRDYENAGFVGYLMAGAVIKNLNLNGTIYIDSESAINAGMIAGQVGGTIDHCVVGGKLNVCSGNAAVVGGIAGRVTVGATDVRLTNLGSSVDVYVMGGASNTCAAGIIGYMNYVPTSTTDRKVVYVLNCFNVGNVSAGVNNDGSENRARSGGIVGLLRCAQEGDPSIALHNCYNAGQITVHSTGGGNGTKSTLDNIAASTNKVAFMDLGTCYSLQGSAVASDNATVFGGISSTEMTLGEMQSSDFMLRLTINAHKLKAGGYGDMYAWKTTADGTPVFADDLVSGNGKELSVSVNIARLGSVKAEVSAGGTGAFTAIGNPALLEKGDIVRLTLLPTSGCAVQSVTISGTSVTVENNTYTFTIENEAAVEVVFQVVSTVDKAPVYVNPVAVPGGDGSIGAPFATLQEAIDKVEAMLIAVPNANITVYLMGGNYVLDETIRLDEAVTSLGRVTFKNYNEAKATVTSAHTINGTWTKVEGKEYYSYQIPASSGNYPAFRDLLVNGVRTQLAKTKDYTYQYNWVNAVVTSGKVTAADNLLYVSAEALNGITNENLNGVEMGRVASYKTQLFHIGSVTGAAMGTEQQISLRQNEFERLFAIDTNQKKLTGTVYWLQNHINFLDEPGEFYYDQSTGTVYYYPTTDVDINTAEIGYATLEYLIEMENVGNVTFDGITFTGTSVNEITRNGLCTQLGNTYSEVWQTSNEKESNVPYAAIHGISNIEGVEVLNCVFKELGGSAMVFDLGVKNLTITGNLIKNLGMAGIQIGKNQRQWNLSGILGACEDVTISNNYITNIGIEVPGAPAIKVARNKNLKIQHNTIIHVPYSGIMFGFGWNLRDTKEHNTNVINADVSYNYIEDFLYRINDGGAIYTCGANDFAENTELFNEIHHNYILAGAHDKSYTGVYHDGSASNFLTHHNVIENVVSAMGSMYFQDNIETQRTHNVTASNNYTSVTPITSSATADRNIVLKDNVMVATQSELLAIPEAKAIMEGAGLEEAYAHIAEPMGVTVKLQESVLHYTIQDDQQGDTTIRVMVTNNYDITKRFTLSIIGTLPSCISYNIGGNDVELAPGHSAVITLNLTPDAQNFYTTNAAPFGFAITEENGKTTQFPRQFTIRTQKMTRNVINKGTPVVDGYLDDDYRNSVCIDLSRTVTNQLGNDPTTDTYGSAYLLWDEQYLYAYIIISDNTVMSRGIDYITEKYANGAGNPNDLWPTDSVEAYLWTSLRNDETKFCIDAFGIQPCTNSNVPFSAVDDLPYATKFTFQGEILDDLEIKNPTEGQYANTKDNPVDGYVIEMTLPWDTCLDLKTMGSPVVNDEVRFFIQINDFKAIVSDPSGAQILNILSMRSSTEYYKLADGHTCEDADGDYRCDICDEKVEHTCEDTDKNHECDLCKTKVGVCKDADKDHLCDYGCGKSYGRCIDKDGDGLCDYGCGKNFNAEVATEASLLTRIINFIITLFSKILAFFGLKI